MHSATFESKNRVPGAHPELPVFVAARHSELTIGVLYDLSQSGLQSLVIFGQRLGFRLLSLLLQELSVFRIIPLAVFISQALVKYALTSIQRMIEGEIS
jgi:hypothetical protein